MVTVRGTVGTQGGGHVWKMPSAESVWMGF